METHSTKFKIRLGLFITIGLSLFVLAIFIIGKQKNLFNPVFNNGPGQWGHERVGERFKEFSPAHNIGKHPIAPFALDQTKRLIELAFVIHP